MENNSTWRTYPSLAGFEERNNPEYVEWLEEVLIALFRERGGTAQKADKKIHKLGLSGEFTDTLLCLIEDRAIRESNPELRDYPLNLVDYSSEIEENAARVNAWEMDFIAKYTDVFTGRSTGIPSTKYDEFLKGLDPYWWHFTEQTRQRLQKQEIAEYVQYREDPNIPWHECKPEQIYFNLEILMAYYSPEYDQISDEDIARNCNKDVPYLYWRTNLGGADWRHLAQMDS